jgi:hypothetical protein
MLDRRTTRQRLSHGLARHKDGRPPALKPCGLGEQTPKGHCGAAAATDDALRHRNDNMFCNTSTASYFTPISPLCLVDAQYTRQGQMRRVLGAASRGGRMKYHGTAPACSNAPYKASRLLCPQCEDLIIAATQSEHISGNEIRHSWTCEACGHQFRTTVRYLRPFAESEAAPGERTPLPGHRETMPSWSVASDLPGR